MRFGSTISNGAANSKHDPNSANSNSHLKPTFRMADLWNGGPTGPTPCMPHAYVVNIGQDYRIGTTPVLTSVLLIQ